MSTALQATGATSSIMCVCISTKQPLAFILFVYCLGLQSVGDLAFAKTSQPSLVCLQHPSTSSCPDMVLFCGCNIITQLQTMLRRPNAPKHAASAAD
jgi:hypothetical protein